MAVWIRLSELPIEHYEPSALLKIGQAIGLVLRIDAYTASNVRGRFARICVQVNLDKPLIYFIQIGKMVQKVQYEGLSSLCFECGRMGHRKESCTYMIKEQPGKDSQQSGPINVSPSQDSANANPCSTSVDKPTSPSSTSSAKMYGKWMVVSRRKGKDVKLPVVFLWKMYLAMLSHLRSLILLLSLWLTSKLAVGKEKGKSWAPQSKRSQSLLTSHEKQTQKSLAMENL